jgi:hypothetical protein
MRKALIVPTLKMRHVLDLLQRRSIGFLADGIDTNISPPSIGHFPDGLDRIGFLEIDRFRLRHAAARPAAGRAACPLR